jgi:hypothetical protein
MIPQVIHRIWVGGAIPERFAQYEKQWRKLHPKWELRLWTDEDFAEPWLENQHLFDNAMEYVPQDAVGQFRADVARYEILLKYGGVYVDCDVEPVKAFDPLMKCKGFAGWEEQGRWVGNTVLAAAAESHVMKEMIEAVAVKSEENKGKAATHLSGPRVLTKVYKNLSNLQRADFTVYPQHYFFPYSYKDLRSTADPAERKYTNAYAIHHWQHQREMRNRPMSARHQGKEIRLSVAIMAHPSREKWVPLLEEQLDNAKVIWDEKQDRWDTGSRAMLAYDKNATHHLVVQDDAVLPPDFLAGVEKMLEYVPPENPVGLYYGRYRPKHYKTRVLFTQAQRMNASFIVHSGPWWGVGVVVPTMHIEEMVAWGHEHPDIPNYDRRMTRWFDSQAIDCWYTMPCLIEHRHGVENPSLVAGRTALNRKAWQFVGDIGNGSALQVDWEGPAVGA